MYLYSTFQLSIYLPYISTPLTMYYYYSFWQPYLGNIPSTQHTDTINCYLLQNTSHLFLFPTFPLFKTYFYRLRHHRRAAVPQARTSSPNLSHTFFNVYFPLVPFTCLSPCAQARLVENHLLNSSPCPAKFTTDLMKLRSTRQNAITATSTIRLSSTDAWTAASSAARLVGCARVEMTIMCLMEGIKGLCLGGASRLGRDSDLK